MKVAIMSGVVTYVILITGRVTGDIPHGGGSMWNVTSWTHHNHHNVTLQPQHDPRHLLYKVIRHVESARVGPSTVTVTVKPKIQNPLSQQTPKSLSNHYGWKSLGLGSLQYLWWTWLNFLQKEGLDPVVCKSSKSWWSSRFICAVLSLICCNLCPNVVISAQSDRG